MSGLWPDDIEIIFTGLRPGEKLYEELYHDDEKTAPTPHPKLRVACSRADNHDDLKASIEELLELVDGPQHVLRDKLSELSPEYCPTDVDEATTQAVSESLDSGSDQTTAPIPLSGLAGTV